MSNTCVHKFLDAVSKRPLAIMYGVQGRNLLARQHEQYRDGHKTAQELAYMLGALPIFFFDTDVLDLIESYGPDVITDTLTAMVQAQAAHVPFRQCLIEYQAANIRWLVAVAESKPGEDHDYLLYINGFENKQEQPVLVPVTVRVDFRMVDGDLHHRIQTHVQGDWHRVEPDFDYDAVEDYAEKIAWNALVLALVIVNTKGMDKEVIEAPLKLNKARAKAGKRIIPSYTYIKIGHVYDKHGHVIPNGSGRHLRMHLRRGHVKNVRYGVGRTNKRPVYIEPCIVNYDPGTQLPPKHYKVKR